MVKRCHGQSQLELEFSRRIMVIGVSLSLTPAKLGNLGIYQKNGDVVDVVDVVEVVVQWRYDGDK